MKYVHSQSTVKPNLVEINGDQVYVRKDITETTDKSGEVSITFYNYEEAIVSIAEFNALANKALMSGQEDTTNNMLVLMEALADMYETMALNM